MDEPNKPQETDQEPEGYTLSSPLKRIAAWVGVVYMIILILLNFYALKTGSWIRGIGPLMLTPAAVGLGASTIWKYRSGQRRGGLPAAILMVCLCCFLVVWGLLLGLPALFFQLGGAA